jgi:hypothetical protein
MPLRGEGGVPGSSNVMRLFDLARSVTAAMRASAAAGRAFRFRDAGDLRGALAQAHIGLDLLRAPYVHRRNPAEGSALASLTIVAEQAAVGLEASGASAEDLLDSIAILNGLKGERQPELCSFIPFLETRLALSPTV